MFAPSNRPDAMTELQRKRAREEEEQMGNGSTGFCEHRNKRIQCLPLRTSPQTSNHWPPSSSITPLNSDSDESLRRSQASPWSTSPAIPSQPQYGYSDMNMMNSAHLGQMHQPQTDCGNGRLPTPMQPTFAAQVRGQQCEWAGPGPAVKSMNGVANMGHHQTGFDEDLFVPRTMAQEADWQTVQNHRRLPSPISEGDDCMSNQHMNSPGMMLDNSFQSQLSIHHETSEPSPQPSPTQAMVHPNAMMDVELHPSGQPTEDPEDPTTPSPNRRGHIRSRHTVNNWTWQPGMKKSFSIGYRSDCEKCRLKVPGHFNHIVIS